MLSMKRKTHILTLSYRVALRHYLKQEPNASLRPALKLGRRAVELGLDTLDLALIHEQALIVQTLPIHPSAIRDRIVRRAGIFFAEAILPMEETHRTALVTNVHLSRLNQSLSRRTLDLATSNRKLKKEIIKRKVMEETLRQSKQNTIQLLDQSQRLQEQLRHLSRRILSAQEEERKRVSRELHDVIVQVLTSINVRLALLKTEATGNTKGLAKNILRTQKLVEKSVGIVHQFAYDLRPAALDFLGLIPALHSFMKKFMKETGIRVSLSTFAEVDQLDSARRTVLFRVAQEALTNVARHAKASRVNVIIRKLPAAICMDISDNGTSFDVARILREGKIRRMGLLGMRERVEMVGGSFHIKSEPGQGTTIQAQIPFRCVVQECARL